MSSLESSGPQSAACRLPHPRAAQPLTVFWQYTISVALIHVLALLALVPWCFSWAGVITCLVGLYVYGMLGVTLCYHRLLTHRSFAVPKWLEYPLAMLGVCCLQDTPARWVAIHRMHHQRSDGPDDPHSPLVNFFWGHVEWFLVKNRDHDGIIRYERYVRDLLRDPFYFWLERKLRWFQVYLAHAALYYLAGLGIGWARTGDVWSGVQLGTSLLVWGVLLRTVLVWHITWSVNSLAHVSGYRNYETKDRSRNNWLVAILASGEGWHNNHHWDQRSAAHGHRWWEYDLTYRVICLLEILGIATKVVRPRRVQAWATQDAQLSEDRELTLVE